MYTMILMLFPHLKSTAKVFFLKAIQNCLRFCLDFNYDVEVVLLQLHFHFKEHTQNHRKGTEGVRWPQCSFVSKTALSCGRCDWTCDATVTCEQISQQCDACSSSSSWHHNWFQPCESVSLLGWVHQYFTYFLVFYFACLANLLFWTGTWLITQKYLPKAWRSILWVLVTL